MPSCCGTAGVSAPFTIEQFMGVFVAYNAAIWPAQLAAYAFGLLGVAALWWKRPDASRLIHAILALMWLWNAIGYHYLFFARINPAATLFAGLFALQAALFVACAAIPGRVTFVARRDLRTMTGLTLIAHAILLYPILGLWAGHGWMAGPMFGVAPCPTVIFTLGLLLMARGRWRVWLSIIPIFWSLIGLAAALQLGMVEDFGLPIAALLLCLAIGRDLVRKKPVNG